MAYRKSSHFSKKHNKTEQDQDRLLVETLNALTVVESQAIRLALLNEMITEFNIASNFEGIYRVIAHKLPLLMDSDWVSLSLINEAGQFELFILDDQPETAITGRPLSNEQTIIHQAVEENRVMVVSDLETTSAAADIALFETEGLRSVAVVPLMIRGQAIGTLNVGRGDPDVYDESDESFMMQLASMIASTFDNRRLFAKTQAMLESLVDERNLLRAIIDNVPDFVYVKDMDSRFVIANRTTVQQLNASQEDNLLGKTDLEFHSPELARKFQADEQRVMQSEKSLVNLEEYYFNPAGEKRWLTTTKIPFYNNQGDLAGLIGVSRDITQRKQAEQTLAKRATELETLLSVSTATALLDMKEVLPVVVELTKKIFDLYHVHIYLLNETQQTLDLVAGEDHQQPIGGASWSIPLTHPDSLVAKAARRGEGIRVGNVQPPPNSSPNPLSRRTMSELVVPMMVGQQLLGVLDLQAEVVDYFTVEDLRLQTAIAAQVAVALQNANLYQQTQHRANQLQWLATIEATLSQATDEAEILTAVTFTMDLDVVDLRVWLYYIDTDQQDKPVTIQTAMFWHDGLSHPEHPTVGQYWPIEEWVLSDVLSQLSGGVLFMTNVSTDERLSDAGQHYLEAQNIQAMAIIPLRSGNLWQGLILFGWPEIHTFSNDEQFYMQRMLEPLAAVIARRRASFQQQETLRITRKLYQAGRQLNEATKLAEIVDVVVAVGTMPATQRALAVIFDNQTKDDNQSMTVVASWPPEIDPPVGWRYSQQIWPDTDILFRREPTFCLDVQPANWLETLSESDPPLLEANSRTMVVLPLWVGNRQLGVLLLQTAESYQFSEQEQQFYLLLAPQVAVAIENRRLLERTQAQVRREQILRRVTAQVRSVTDVETVMRTAVQEVGQALNCKTFVNLEQ